MPVRFVIGNEHPLRLVINCRGKGKDHRPLLTAVERWALSSFGCTGSVLKGERGRGGAQEGARLFWGQL
jgi:hypothetical protein